MAGDALGLDAGDGREADIGQGPTCDCRHGERRTGEGHKQLLHAAHRHACEGAVPPVRDNSSHLPLSSNSTDPDLNRVPPYVAMLQQGTSGRGQAVLLTYPQDSPLPSHAQQIAQHQCVHQQPRKSRYDQHVRLHAHRFASRRLIRLERHKMQPCQLAVCLPVGNLLCGVLGL